MVVNVKYKLFKKTKSQKKLWLGTAWKYSCLSSLLARLLGFHMLGESFCTRGVSTQYLGIVNLTKLNENLKLEAKVITIKSIILEDEKMNPGYISRERSAIPLGKYILPVLASILSKITRQL